MTRDLTHGPKTSVLNMIDLAGSEKPSQSSLRRKEGAFINKSLLTLGTVISKLGSVKGHIPFRDSKLTKILQPFLQSGSHISVILTVGENISDSLNTLAFGMRLKNMKPRHSKLMSDQTHGMRIKVQELQDVLDRLRLDCEIERGMWEETLQDIYQVSLYDTLY